MPTGMEVNVISHVWMVMRYRHHDHVLIQLFVNPWINIIRDLSVDGVGLHLIVLVSAMCYNSMLSIKFSDMISITNL